MDNMKIRYVHENKYNRTITCKILSIESIEDMPRDCFYPITTRIIGRDLCTNKQDATRTKEFPNGKGIFENDIVSAHIYSDETPQILKVEFRDAGFFIDYNDGECDTFLISDFSGSIEIVGNVWQNPELLGVKV